MSTRAVQYNCDPNDCFGYILPSDGMEAFAAKQLQVSGRNVTLTPRLGLESEIVPGWLRPRGGSYLEASRFPETSARWHGTAGLEVRTFSFHLGGHERRVSLSAARDFADPTKPRDSY